MPTIGLCAASVAKCFLWLDLPCAKRYDRLIVRCPSWGTLFRSADRICTSRVIFFAPSRVDQVRRARVGGRGLGGTQHGAAVMIEVKNLTKRYGSVVAVDDISFSVASGEIIGFLGPNGAGKTTTMRVLTGFSPPTSGSAIVAGHDISKSPVEVKKRVGYLPESVPLYSDMVVRSFLGYVAEIKGVSRRQRRSEVDRVMERCGLVHMAKRLIQNLSRGYRQRVGLAQALIGSPSVLILDEPTVGLDPKQIVEIRKMIKELAEDHTVLLSTHILPEVAMICQRVLIINQGRIVAKDTMDNLAKTDGRQFHVEVDGPAGWAAAALQQIPGVLSVNELGEGQYDINASPRDDVPAEIAKRLVAGGLGLRCLEEEHRSLEDVFMEVIATDPGTIS